MTPRDAQNIGALGAKGDLEGEEEGGWTLDAGGGTSLIHFVLKQGPSQSGAPPHPPPPPRLSLACCRCCLGEGPSTPFRVCGQD